jgi:hypothetical protein
VSEINPPRVCFPSITGKSKKKDCSELQLSHGGYPQYPDDFGFFDRTFLSGTLLLTTSVMG